MFRIEIIFLSYVGGETPRDSIQYKHSTHIKAETKWPLTADGIFYSTILTEIGALQVKVYRSLFVNINLIISQY